VQKQGKTSVCCARPKKSRWTVEGVGTGKKKEQAPIVVIGEETTENGVSEAVCAKLLPSFLEKGKGRGQSVGSGEGEKAGKVGGLVSKTSGHDWAEHPL